ncbi:MAG TPA: hypothetical protein VEJ23_01035 [Solirubrobacteraceae bacterium]|nr:hypothetical protein [Solirubrobacteraceae bacterium]
MASRRLSLVALQLTLLLGLWFICLAWGAGGALAKPGDGVSGAKQRPVEVALAPLLAQGGGVTVTSPPVGLSIEYPVMAADLGAGTCPPPGLPAELLRLGSPPLELAGASQDLTAPSGALSGQPSSWETATLYSLPAAFWTQLHCLLSVARDPLTVGLNMRSGNLGWATQIAAGAQSAATNGLTFSLGNEPDLYGLPNYSSLDKPLPGAEGAEASLYLQLAAYLRPAVGAAPIIGPELSRADWRAQLPRVISQLHPQTVGVHLYPLTTCRTPSEVTLGGLLSSPAADAPARLAWVVADARAAGLPAIISEANSASCGGRAGVSDSPAAAVWAVRFVLSALKTGFGEVRFHFSGNPYDPFIVSGGQVLARPLESALVALNQWLPVGASLRTVPGIRELVASVVRQPSGTGLLILDNERARARPVVLHTSRGVRGQLLTATRAAPQDESLTPAHGRIRLTLAANSVLALSLAQ